MTPKMDGNFGVVSRFGFLDGKGVAQCWREDLTGGGLIDKQTFILLTSWSKKRYVLTMLERTAEKHLNTWYQKNRRKPLVIRGARQVGKSTLVRQFAQDNGLILNEINLEQHLYLDNIFKSLDMDAITQRAGRPSRKEHTRLRCHFIFG